ncbi:MAG TPA: tetratricopeptide repeat protein [Bryobacteraceae bacterium]|nr:tetratricopeptide repeat protein [Bryobacteraceae bacterium]
MRRGSIISLLLLAICPLPGLAAEQWIKLETPHFELYTSAGEKNAREAILYFEQVRSFFLEAIPSKRVPEFPVRIVAFRSEKEFKPYRINEAAAAYYTRGRYRDYIVMEDISSEHYPTAIHEYTHLIVEHSGLKLPPWLNEGWADLYSSLQPRGNKAMVGALLPGRIQTLSTQKWLSLDVLAAVDHHSPLYNERDKAGMFYAESWLLTHMLYLSAGYREHFSQFLLAVADGKNIAEAFQSVYNKSLAEVTKDLNSYARGDRFFGVLFNVKLEKSVETPDVSQASEFESGLVLADLLGVIGKRDQAGSAFEEMAKENPDRPEIEVSLGYLAWQSGDTATARKHFARAFAAGSKDPQMCFHYAVLERQAGEPAKDVLPALRKAVELKPDYVEARLELGLELVNDQDYKDAVTELRQIKKINPEQARYYFPALAYADMQTGDAPDARKNAESAKKWAKTPEETERANSFLQYLDQQQAAALQAATPRPAPVASATPSPALSPDTGDHPLLVRRSDPDPPQQLPPPDPQLARAEGMAQSLDCSGPSAKLRVLVDSKIKVFQITDPTSVTIKHSGEAHHDFTCGAQKPFHVVIEYAPAPDSKAAIAGIIRSLEF